MFILHLLQDIFPGQQCGINNYRIVNSCQSSNIISQTLFSDTYRRICLGKLFLELQLHIQRKWCVVCTCAINYGRHFFRQPSKIYRIKPATGNIIVPDLVTSHNIRLIVKCRYLNRCFAYFAFLKILIAKLSERFPPFAIPVITQDAF